MSLSKCCKKRKADGEKTERLKRNGQRNMAAFCPNQAQNPCVWFALKLLQLWSANVKCHYDTKHSQFEERYPQSTPLGTAKHRQLKSSYEATSKLFVRSMTEKKATDASLQVARVLGKHKKSFSDAEIVKECLGGIVEAMRERRNRRCQKNSSKAIIQLHFEQKNIITCWWPRKAVNWY